MRQNSLGPCFSVSRLALGGGGIGQVWGATDHDEAIATVLDAYDSGINFFDLAPLYGDGKAERVVGEAFAGGYPDDVRLTTKCMLGDRPNGEIAGILEASLDASCARLGRDFVDVFILHGFVVEDGFTGSRPQATLQQVAVPYSKYIDHVVPAFDALKQNGRIGAWGVTAASTNAANRQVLDAPRTPEVVQCITNLLDSPGGMAMSDEVPAPRETITRASELGIGVMGIRAVAAGSLTGQLDREVHPKSAELSDYYRAAAFRAFAAEAGESPSFLAHQYALSMAGVDTVVLGVKNREELKSAVRAESLAPMSAEVMAAIDALSRSTI